MHRPCYLWLLLIVAMVAAPPVAMSQPATAEVEADVDTYALPESNDGLPGVGPIRRYDWFQNLWRQRRSQWSQQVQQDQGALVFFGDSITQGWGDRLASEFPGAKIANRGISGDTTRGMLLRLDDDVLQLNPSGIVMLMGTNDIEEQATPTQVANNTLAIIERLGEHNSAMPIIVCRVMPSSASKKRPAAKLQAVNQLVEAGVRDNSQVTVLDTWSLFVNDDGEPNLDEFPDLLHPNNAGYAKWAAALRPILESTGLVEAEDEPFELEPGFESLFNGKDLTGWQFRPTPERDLKARANWRANDPNAPPWPIITEVKSLDGQTSSDDGRFIASNGRLIVTTPSEGRRIQQLWTADDFGDDFVLKLEFRASPNADSGIYVRGPQLQCRDYLLAGPYTELQHYKPLDWNEIVVTVTGQTAHATCNDEVLEEAMPIPATGPIGLEGDRGQMEFRRIRILQK